MKWAASSQKFPGRGPVNLAAYTNVWLGQHVPPVIRAWYNRPAQTRFHLSLLSDSPLFFTIRRRPPLSLFPDTGNGLSTSGGPLFELEDNPGFVRPLQWHPDCRWSLVPANTDVGSMVTLRTQQWRAEIVSNISTLLAKYGLETSASPPNEVIRRLKTTYHTGKCRDSKRGNSWE